MRKISDQLAFYTTLEPSFLMTYVKWQKKILELEKETIVDISHNVEFVPWTERLQETAQSHRLLMMISRKEYVERIQMFCENQQDHARMSSMKITILSELLGNLEFSVEVVSNFRHGIRFFIKKLERTGIFENELMDNHHLGEGKYLPLRYFQKIVDFGDTYITHLTSVCPPQHKKQGTVRVASETRSHYN